MYLQRRGGRLTSVDNDANHCAFARQWTRCFGEAVDVSLADSIAWLKGGSEPIDLLYLDSLDADQARCAEHGLAEIQAAYSRLRGRSMVVCDDTVYRANAFHGKGALLVPWLIERGWQVLFSGHQTILSL
jgi:predicted O-methyltransferase YrrM